MQLSASPLPFDFSSISPSDLGAATLAAPGANNPADVAPDAFGALLNAETGPAAAPTLPTVALPAAPAPFSLGVTRPQAGSTPADGPDEVENDGEELSAPAAEPPDSDPVGANDGELLSWMTATAVGAPTLPLPPVKPESVHGELAESLRPISDDTPASTAPSAEPAPFAGTPDIGVPGKRGPRNYRNDAGEGGASRAASQDTPRSVSAEPFGRRRDAAPPAQIAATYAQKTPGRFGAPRFAGAGSSETNAADVDSAKSLPAAVGPAAAPQIAALDPSAAASVVATTLPPTQPAAPAPSSPKSSGVVAALPRATPAPAAAPGVRPGRFSSTAVPLDLSTRGSAVPPPATSAPMPPSMEFPRHVAPLHPDAISSVDAAPAESTPPFPAEVHATGPFDPAPRETSPCITAADTRVSGGGVSPAATSRSETAAVPAAAEALTPAPESVEPASVVPTATVPAAAATVAPEFAPAEISLLGISSITDGAAEKIAVGVERSAKVGSTLKKLGIKNSLTTAEQDVVDGSIGLGINVAKTRNNMPVLASASNRPSIDVAPSTFSAPVLDFAALADEPPQAARYETSGAAHRTVESVLAVADHFTTGGQHGVNLKFSVSGVDLAVRVEVRGGNIQATFRTDSPELRAALATEWRAVAAESGERGQQLAEPVFTSSASSHDSLQADSGASDQRGSNSRPDQFSFENHAAPRAASRRSAASEPAAVATAVSLPLPGRLHALA